MIGDNPRADIKGASEIGWASFLTQTGVHQGAENDPENPATMVVNTFAETVEAVLKIKREKLYLWILFVEYVSLYERKIS